MIDDRHLSEPCPRCGEVHEEPLPCCPGRSGLLMLDHAVPCVNATQWESDQNKHLTWNDDRICTRCVRIMELFAKRRELNDRFEEDGVS